MFSQYRSRYNAMVSWESPLEIEVILDPGYETATAEITVTGDISTTNNKVIFIVTNHQTNDYFCSVVTYDEYTFDLTEIGSTGTFVHTLNTSGYNIDNLTVNVLVQTLSPNYQILQAGRVIVSEAVVPLHVESIDFDPVMVGETASQTIQLFNYGNTELTGMIFPPVGFTAPADYNVAAHSIGEVEITFAPQQAGEYSDIMIVTTSLVDYPTFFIDVTGEGLPSNAVISDEVSPLIEITGNYPNPFNPVTTLRFNLLQDESVSLIIYNIRGEEVAVLQDGWLSAGEHQIFWQAEGLAGGVYLAKLKAGVHTSEHKMILLK
ncbi:MAG: T9SS type A sorting domain-containing protein [Candidatus Cloacimonetes bacterium]|nr:T9SS type A sorting domain-containing protein [Candidatus Cloacimonadota bacterium]